MNFIATSYNRGSFHGGPQLQALTNDAMRRIAPSIFAEQPHESRSERYGYVPTFQVVEGMRQAGFLPVSVTQSRSRVPGKQPFTKHQIRFSRAEALEALDRKVGDTIPQILLTNSHDGSSAYVLELAEWRLACLNGLIVSSSNIETVKVPHTSKARDRVIEGSFQVIQRADTAQEQIEAFRATQLTHQEAEVFARNALMLRFDTEDPTALPIRPDQALRVRREADQGNDLWRVFNRVQESVIRGGQHYRAPAHRTEAGRYVGPRNMTVREVKGIDQSSNLNRALWRMAEEMRNLKAAA